ncbi:MAG: trypsin-like peptidase domain-containing protein [Vicinamibacterales bacterium]
MIRQAGALIGLAAVVSFLLGLVAAGTRPPLSHGVAAISRPATDGAPLVVQSTAQVPVIPTSVSASVDFAEVASRLNAAVVNVDIASRGSDDLPRFSRRRYSTDDTDAPREGSGSGFIIDPNGFILTNHHVVTGADRVTVTLSDGRSFRAEVVGVDEAMDVALLKVNTTDKLPVAPLGNSDTLRVGEWVCAIGNPLGVYVHSVTVGVVSFLGRKLFDPSLDAFIQTDAAISFGNSGGPLINARGEVVGITTAISAQAMNIGFAIPIGQVVAVLPQLRERGTVARGYIGLGLTTVTPALRRALHLGPDSGALVQDVTPDTPADRAGLRPYDVIVGLDQQPVQDDQQLSRRIASRQPGTTAALDVWRDGAMRHVLVKLAVRELTDATRAQFPRTADVRAASHDDAPLGISVRDLDDTTAEHLRIPPSVQGVLVTEVDPAGPARLAQVRTNHVILELNRQRVRSAAEFRGVAGGLKAGEAAALLIFDRSTRQRVIYTVVSDSQP